MAAGREQVRRFVREYVKSEAPVRALPVAEEDVASAPADDDTKRNALRTYMTRQRASKDTSQVFAVTTETHRSQGLPVLAECPVASTPTAMPKAVRQALLREGKDVPRLSGAPAKALLAQNQLSEEHNEVLCIVPLAPDVKQVKHVLFEADPNPTSDMLEIIMTLRTAELPERQRLVREIRNTFTVLRGSQEDKMLKTLESTDDLSSITDADAREKLSKVVRDVLARAASRQKRATGQSFSEQLYTQLQQIVGQVEQRRVERERLRAAKMALRGAATNMSALESALPAEQYARVQELLAQGAGGDDDDDEMSASDVKLAEQMQAQLNQIERQSPGGLALAEIGRRQELARQRGEQINLKQAALQVAADEAASSSDASSSRKSKKRFERMRIGQTPVNAMDIATALFEQGLLNEQAIAMSNEFNGVEVCCNLTLGQVQELQQMLLLYHRMKQSMTNASRALMDAISAFYLYTQTSAPYYLSVTFRGGNLIEPPELNVGDLVAANAPLRHVREPEMPHTMRTFTDVECNLRNEVRRQIKALQEPRTALMGQPMVAQLDRDTFDALYADESLVLTPCSSTHRYFKRVVDTTEMTDVRKDTLFHMVKLMGTLVSLPQQIVTRDIESPSMTVVRKQVLVLSPSTADEVELLRAFMLKPGAVCDVRGNALSSSASSANQVLPDMVVAFDRNQCMSIVVIPAAVLWKKEGTQAVMASEQRIRKLREAAAADDANAIRALQQLGVGYASVGRYIPRVVVAASNFMTEVVRQRVLADERLRALGGHELGGDVEQARYLYYLSAQLSLEAGSSSTFMQSLETGMNAKLKLVMSLYKSWMGLLYYGQADGQLFLTDPGLVTVAQRMAALLRESRSRTRETEVRVGDLLQEGLHDDAMERKLQEMQARMMLQVANFVVEEGRVVGLPGVKARKGETVRQRRAVKDAAAATAGAAAASAAASGASGAIP